MNGVAGIMLKKFKHKYSTKNDKICLILRVRKQSTNQHLLNLYISHAPADKQFVVKFMEWFKPMQEKYYVRVWYNHPEPEPIVPFPWNVLFFWYSPPRSGRPYHRDLLKEVDQAHIYLFFTSQKSITTGWIDQEEVPRAVDRYQQHGRNYIRIHPVVVSASQWKTHSRLAAYPTLGPAGGKAMNQVTPTEDGWNGLMDQLKPIIEELRRNHIEENKRLGHSIKSFNTTPPPWGDTPQKVLPLPNWIGWVMVVAIFWSVSNWYAGQCKPQYKPYWPKKNPPQEEYRRENPVRPPVDIIVPQAAPIDTSVRGRIRDPK